MVEGLSGGGLGLECGGYWTLWPQGPPPPSPHAQIHRQDVRLAHSKGSCGGPLWRTSRLHVQIQALQSSYLAMRAPLTMRNKTTSTIILQHRHITHSRIHTKTWHSHHSHVYTCVLSHSHKHVQQHEIWAAWPLRTTSLCHTKGHLCHTRESAGKPSIFK